jgi:hypothetical protein
MKLLFCLLAGMLSLSLAAQKPFEGTIRYKVIVSPRPDTVDLSIFFGKNRTRLQVNNKENEHSVILLTDLDSGLLHSLEPSQKTYMTRKLRTRQERPEAPPPGNRTIAGHAATGVNLSADWPEYLPLMSIAERAVIYTGNDLLFPVPEKYAQNLELVFVHKGHIVLAGEVSINESYRAPVRNEEVDSALKPRLSFEAQEIIPGPVNPALLGIPADYTLMDMFSTDSVDMMMDTSGIMIDTAITIDEEIPPPPPPKKPQVKKPAQKKTPAKKPATKTSVSGTKKQAARKPE